MAQVDQISELIKPIIEREGLSLFDLEMVGGGHGRMTLRVFIDKEGGVTIDDCATLSRQLDMALEVEDIISGAYVLEVSSPGLTRALKTSDHYKKSLGKLAIIKLRANSDSSKALGGKALGVIESADDDSVTFREKESGDSYLIRYEEIAKANLEIE